MIKHEEVRKIILFVPKDEILLQTYITEQEKKDELLELYRLKNCYMEDYYTYNSLRGSQKAFDNLKDVNEEICIKENELEEMK